MTHSKSPAKKPPTPRKAERLATAGPLQTARPNAALARFTPYWNDRVKANLVTYEQFDLALHAFAAGIETTLTEVENRMVHEMESGRGNTFRGTLARVLDGLRKEIGR